MLRLSVRECVRHVMEKEELMHKFAELVREEKWFRKWLCWDQECTRNKLDLALIVEVKDLSVLKKTNAKFV